MAALSRKIAKGSEEIRDPGKNTNRTGSITLASDLLFATPVCDTVSQSSKLILSSSPFSW